MRGEWIEMLSVLTIAKVKLCLSLCGESGLKSGHIKRGSGKDWSLPLRGEWIEMLYAPPVS